MTKLNLKPALTGTGSITIEAPATDVAQTITLPDQSGNILLDTSTINTDQLTRKMTSVTAVVSGTSTTIDIPSWAKKVTLLVDNVSSNAASVFYIRMLDDSLSGGTMAGAGDFWATSPAVEAVTLGLKIGDGTTSIAATAFVHGIATFMKHTDTRWIGTFLGGTAGGANFAQSWCHQTLTTAPTKIGIFTAAGTFDDGSVTIMYEG